jgi:hypothetical protein
MHSGLQWLADIATNVRLARLEKRMVSMAKDLLVNDLTNGLSILFAYGGWSSHATLLVAR